MCDWCNVGNYGEHIFHKPYAWVKYLILDQMLFLFQLSKGLVNMHEEGLYSV